MLPARVLLYVSNCSLHIMIFIKYHNQESSQEAKVHIGQILLIFSLA